MLPSARIKDPIIDSPPTNTKSHEKFSVSIAYPRAKGARKAIDTTIEKVIDVLYIDSI